MPNVDAGQYADSYMQALDLDENGSVNPFEYASHIFSGDRQGEYDGTLNFDEMFKINGAITSDPQYANDIFGQTVDKYNLDSYYT